MAPTARQHDGTIALAVLAGLCFAPVFGLGSLLLPVLAVGVVAVLVVHACDRRHSLAAWRPVLLVVGGLLAIIETVLFRTTIAGLPGPDTIRALGNGLRSWRRTLESTWPARPDADLLLFVPLLVLLACLLGTEVLDRAGALPALLPSLLVAGVAQAYQSLSAATALLIAFGYAALAAVVLVAPRPPGRTSRPRRRRTGERDLSLLTGAVALVVAAVIGGFVVLAVAPDDRAPMTLHKSQPADATAPRTTNPLDQIAERLGRPDQVVFRYRSDLQVDRWRLVSLEDFDGSNWTTRNPFLRLGSDLAPDPGIRVPLTAGRADFAVAGLDGPWLPSQPSPRRVDGAGEVFVEPEGGTVVANQRPQQFTLSWSAPQATADQLLAAGVDSRADLGELGSVPAEIATLAVEATGGRRATFQTALALERYLAERCELASSGVLPTGHGWPQIRQFLLDTERGTSEQFAAAYVALARLNGIPARLVVGFRAPDSADLDGWTTVRNRDVLAWPEVAVNGVGWWPLDPAGLADPAKPVTEKKDDVTQQARSELPPPQDLADPPVPLEEDAGPGGLSLPGPGVGWRTALWLLAIPVACWLIGVPLTRRVRAVLRQRRRGSAGVVGAWAEVRDRLRAHGVPVTSGMTVRDLAGAAGPIAGDRTRDGLDKVAGAVDRSLWSDGQDQTAAPDAWAGVRDVVRGLRSRPFRAQLRAALDIRSLLPRRG